MLYLGCSENDQWNRSQKVKGHIKIARKAFNDIWKVLYKYKWGTGWWYAIYILHMTYGAEAWRLTEITASNCGTIDECEPSHEHNIPQTKKC